MYNINFISEIVVAMRKTTRTSCNRLLICLLHDFTECFQFLSRALHEKLFKLVLTYIKNDRELWLSNKNFIFVKFTLAWILSHYNRCFVLFAVLINMPSLHSLKTRHEQQKERDYLKKEPIVFGIPVKN